MERYLYNSLKNAGSSNKELKNRCRRVRNQGYWKNQRSYNIISEKNNNVVVGLKKLLSYEPAETETKDGVQWIMHEYSLATTPSDLVLCRLKRKLPPPPKEDKEKTEKAAKQSSSSVFASTSSKKRTRDNHARLLPPTG
ncbi:NAC domain-containing protein 40 [Bienertia sinuspersici]